MFPSLKFKRCDAVTAAWEGGYVNHPKDPGGPTDRGVTQATYDAWRKKRGLALKPVKGISATEAEQLFFDEFWSPINGERLAIGVDLATYDGSVNSGVSRGLKWLHASVGGSDVQTIKNICAKRLGFMQSLKIWKSFGKGWGRRVADIQAKAIAWSLAATAAPSVVAEQMSAEAAKKDAVARRQSAGSVASSVGSGTTVISSSSQQAVDWTLTGIGVVIALVAVVFAWRAILNRQQATALRQAMPTGGVS